MKKSFLLIGLAMLHCLAVAQTYLVDLTTVSTNIVGAKTNILVGDPLSVAFSKVNSNTLYFSSIISGGSGAGITNFFFTASNLPPGSAATATNTGVVGGIAYVTIGIPTGSNGVSGTNLVTSYSLSNSWLGSQQITTYASNYLAWGTSNFLARVPGLYKWQLNGGALGGGGLAPPTNVAINLVGSFSGSNSWFTITDGFYTSNTISVAAVGAGGGNGFAYLFSIDRWELVGRTNFGYGQHYQFGSPAGRSDPADKAYVDDSIQNSLATSWAFTSDTNLSQHYTYTHNGKTVADFGEMNSWVPITSANLDGASVNLLLTVAQTNLVAGWTLESNTNLASLNTWLQWTNFTSSTNTGIVTLTVPVNFSEPQRFFRARVSTSSAFTLTVPIVANGGVYYPSNAWSLATVTNGMGNRAFWIGSSNGTPVMVTISNGVPTVKFL